MICPYCTKEIIKFNVQQIYDDYTIAGPEAVKQIMEPKLRKAIFQTAAIICPHCDTILHFVKE